MREKGCHNLCPALPTLTISGSQEWLLWSQFYCSWTRTVKHCSNTSANKLLGPFPQVSQTFSSSLSLHITLKTIPTCFYSTDPRLEYRRGFSADRQQFLTIFPGVPSHMPKAWHHGRRPQHTHWGCGYILFSLPTNILRILSWCPQGINQTQVLKTFHSSATTSSGTLLPYCQSDSCFNIILWQLVLPDCLFYL